MLQSGVSRTPGMIRVQLSRMPDGTRYFCIARTVRNDRGGYHAPHSMLSVSIGCEARFARELVYSDGVDVEIPLVVETSTGWINRSDEMIQIITDAMQSIGLTGTTSMSIEHGASTEMFIVPRDEIPPDRGMLALWQHSNELMDYSASIAGYYTCESPISTFCDPAVDEQIAEAGALSGEERDAALQEIAAILLEEMAIVPIGHPNVRYGMADRLDWEHRLDGFILLKEMTLND